MYQRCISDLLEVRSWRGRRPASRRSASSEIDGSCASTASTPRRDGTDRDSSARTGPSGYAWAIPHIERGLGAVRLDRLDREDVARWLESIAAAGELSRRSIQVCRNVLRAALADAVEEGLLRRSPGARVPLPREIAKAAREKPRGGLDGHAGRSLPPGRRRSSLGGRLPPGDPVRPSSQ